MKTSTTRLVLVSIMFVSIIGISIGEVTAQDEPVPATLHLVGRLTKADGSAVREGDHRVMFRLYDASDAIVGREIWREEQTLSVVGGVVNASLGSVTPIDAGLFSGTNRWLGIQVEDDNEMTPRFRVSSVPYALRAQQVEEVPIHEHGDQYAPAGHNHDGVYTPVDHTHEGVYASSDHNHEGVYSLSDHNHDGRYSAPDHNHDGRYASAAHDHPRPWLDCRAYHSGNWGGYPSHTVVTCPDGYEVTGCSYYNSDPGGGSGSRMNPEFFEDPNGCDCHAYGTSGYVLCTAFCCRLAWP